MSSDRLQWRRRIFASVDLMGSTAFKARSLGGSGEWAPLFRQFFQDFPSTVDEMFEAQRGKVGVTPAGAMRVWKFLGDEILFVADLASHEEVVFHALVFRNALTRATEDLKKKPGVADLALKGTLWGAGFPVGNTTVKVTAQQHRIDDYLGPCIDQGFRLTNLADSRRIPLSVDLAWMIANTAVHDGLRIHCEEPRPHKGITYPYPYLWLDRDDRPSAEDTILKRRSEVDLKDLKKYLAEVYTRGHPTLRRPFIDGSKHPEFSQIPKEMEEKRESLLRSDPSESYEPNEVEASAPPKEPPPDASLKS